MPKRKKKAELPPCTHCNVVFQVVVKWCVQCKDHLGSGGWVAKKETCDRCASGQNDTYIHNKTGREARIEAALLLQKDPKNWADDGVVTRYNDWVASPGYAGRFKDERHDSDRPRRDAGQH